MWLWVSTKPFIHLQGRRRPPIDEPLASAAVELCLMIEGQEGVTWQDWAALADACETSGLAALFRSDHYLSGDGLVGRGSHDAWTTLAALAARTSRIRLGTMVSPVTFRHPSLVANAAMTVDHISGGRAELGLGAGWYELEHQVYGFPFPPMAERMAMLEEQLEIVSRQWIEHEFSFSGNHYTLERCQATFTPVQSPLPVIVGGAGKKRTVELAARFGHEYNVVSGEPDECRAVHRRIVEACSRLGRDPLRFSLMTTVLVGRDRDELHRRGDRLGELFYDGQSGEQLLAEHGDGWICGTVDEAAEKLEALAAAGVQRAMLQHLDHRDLEAVHLFGSELAPRVSGL
jgi:F420-dependent oxidoreductase-like protein